MDDLEIFVENEREWRKFIVKKLDKIEAKQDLIQVNQAEFDKTFNVFKIKVAVMIAVLSGSVETFKHWFLGK